MKRPKISLNVLSLCSKENNTPDTTTIEGMQARQRQFDHQEISRLEEMVKKGEFREDLLYRINIIPFRLPPLRERTEDIEILANHYLNFFNKEHLTNIKGFTKEAKRLIKQYPWPGNIRELEHVIEHAVIISTEDYITPEGLDINIEKMDTSKSSFREAKKKIYEILNPDHIKEILKEFDGNVTQAAEELGISKRYLYKLIKKYSIK